MLNITRLQILRELANRKTLSAVAEAFFMSPSAVSQQLSTLEREVGIPLIERQGRGVRLTTAGHELVTHSEAVFEALEHAEASLVRAREGLVGTVRISAFPTGARTLVIPTALKLEESQPNLTLLVTDLEPEEALPMLGSGELDFVVYYEWSLLPAISSAGVKVFPLASEPLYLALPAGHPLATERRPVALAELADERWLAGRAATSMHEILAVATSHAGYEPRTTFRSMDYGVILAGVAAGLGISVVPALALTGDLHGIQLRPLSDFALTRTIKAAVRTGAEYSPLIAAVLESLTDEGERLQQKLKVIDAMVEAYPEALTLA